MAHEMGVSLIAEGAETQAPDRISAGKTAVIIFRIILLFKAGTGDKILRSFG